METEREYKALIDKNAFETLKTILAKKYPVQEIMQKNHYYDTSGFTLCQKDETLRVREKLSSLTLEYKYGKTFSDGVRKCTELSQKIDAIPSFISVEDKKNLGIDESFKLELVGVATTHRYDFTLPNALLSLDYSTYLGAHDYELEIEISSDDFSPASLEEIANIDFSKPPLGKYARFVEVLMLCNED